MGNDYPDFTEFAYIDIWTQTLGKVLIRPTYGGAKFATYNAAITPSDTTELVSINGEGMLYGGFGMVVGAALPISDYFNVVLDGTTHIGHQFQWLAYLMARQPMGSLPGITSYDAPQKTVGVVFGGGITFETSYVLNYIESLGNATNVWVKIIYALV